jgi:hypothetical protein
MRHPSAFVTQLRTNLVIFTRKHKPVATTDTDWNLVDDGVIKNVPPCSQGHLIIPRFVNSC